MQITVNWSGIESWGATLDPDTLRVVDEFGVEIWPVACEAQPGTPTLVFGQLHPPDALVTRLESAGWVVEIAQ